MNKQLKYGLILIILSYFFFVFGNSLISLTNPDEVFYTMTAKEMLQKNTWMTPYLFDVPQFEKPVLLYWLLRIAFILFGVTSFSARFFPAVFGLLGVLAVYSLGIAAFKNEKKAFLGALILMSSGLYFGLSRTVFTDMIFSVFILLALVSFYWGYVQKSRKNTSIISFFIFMALAVLTKGPLGLLVPFLIVLAFLQLKNNLKYLFSTITLWGILLFVLIAFPWYILMIKKYGSTFTYEFFYNCHLRRILEAEHSMNDTWYFYPASMIICMFPWSIYVAISLFYLFKNIKRHTQDINLFLICWIVITFFIFQPAHSKLVSYIFPMFPALAIVAGDFIYEANHEQKKKRIFFRASWINWAILLLLPVGLNGALPRLTHYLASKTPVYVFSALIFIWLLIMLKVFLKRRVQPAAYLTVFFIPIILVIVPLVRNTIEIYASSKSACEYLQKNYVVSDTILVSKFYARGVHFYTDKEVAVINIPGTNYFSPHPIPFLNTDEKVAAFLRQQPVTYAIVKESNIEDLNRLRQEFKIDLLERIGNEYILKIERIKLEG